MPAENLPVYPCRFVPREVALSIDRPDAAWERAEAVPLVDVCHGGPPRQATQVRALWSLQDLFVWFECEDRDVWGTLRERDAPICEEEVVEVFLNPSGDERAYFEIEVSPRNTVYDLFVLNPGDRRRAKFLKAWDCDGLRTIVRVRGDLSRATGTDRGWSAQLAIPLEEMITAPHVPPRPGERWRWNLYRIDRAPEGDEYSAFSPTGAVDYHRPDRFGWLHFVRE